MSKNETQSVANLFSVTEVELIYRNKRPRSERARITKSYDAFNILLNAWDFNKIELVEQFVLMLLDRNNTVLGISNISTGGVSSCIVDPKILFATALKAKASGIIMAHNHPSGNLHPSRADEALTNKMKEGGKLLDISVLDHMIITPQAYYSFADEGLLP